MPTIKEASLLGISDALWADQSVPVLLYTDAQSDRRMVVYAFNYTLVDRMDSLAVLNTDLRTQLASAQAPLFRKQTGQGVAVWRQRDDILVLVAPSFPESALRARLQLWSAADSAGAFGPGSSIRNTDPSPTVDDFSSSVPP